MFLCRHTFYTKRGSCSLGVTLLTLQGLILLSSIISDYLYTTSFQGNILIEYHTPLDKSTSCIHFRWHLYGHLLSVTDWLILDILMYWQCKSLITDCGQVLIMLGRHKDKASQKWQQSYAYSTIKVNCKVNG